MHIVVPARAPRILVVFAIAATLGTCAVAWAEPPADAHAGTTSQRVESSPGDAGSPEPAPDPGAPAGKSQDALQEVVVTGTSIHNPAFTSPSMVTSIGSTYISQRNLPDIGTMVNEIPSFRATEAPGANPLSPGGGTGIIGARVLDLHALGQVHTLVLVDSKNFVPTNTQFTVDTNMIPSLMVKRVDVITGGASATYGSGAVSGVVNFILDRNFTGFKTKFQWTGAEHGGDRDKNYQVMFGHGFWGDRGHFVLAGELDFNDGVGPCRTRNYCANGLVNFGNPGKPGTLGLPADNILGNVVPSAATTTGLITAPSALRGYTFTPEGQPTMFQFGDNGLTNSLFQVGGTGSGPGANGHDAFFGDVPIVPAVHRYAIYGQATAVLVPDHENFTHHDITGSIDISYGNSVGISDLVPYRNLFSAPQRTISASNPFVPAQIAQIAQQNGITSFTLGKFGLDDLGSPQDRTDTGTLRIVSSLDGQLPFHAFGSRDWSWDFYYEFGRTAQSIRVLNMPINQNLNEAINAVTGPNGQPICAANLPGSAAPDPACVPLDLFGLAGGTGPDGAPLTPGAALFPAARAFVTGTVYQHVLLREDTIQGSFSGDVVDIPGAGPVSFAAGAQWRRDDAAGSADPISERLGFFEQNGSAVSGTIGDVQSFVETNIPLLSGLPGARELDLNAAARRSFYHRSSAGFPSSDVDETSWKAGIVWNPSDFLTFRATRSKDARAPNVFELFGPTTSGFSILTDPFTGRQTNPQIISGSSPNLVPEVGYTTTLGTVIRGPADGILGHLRFLHRLSISADYYRIRITDSIGTLGAQDLVDRCFDGAQEDCALITRDSTDTITAVRDVQQNVNEEFTDGWDMQASYLQPLGRFGQVDFIAMNNYVYHLITVDSAGSLDRAGQTGQRATTPPGVPRYKINALAIWSWRNWSANVGFIYIPSGIYNAQFIGPGQPGYSITNPVSVNINTVGHRDYVNIGAQYSASIGGATLAIFGKIDNLTDTPNIVFPGDDAAGNATLFDAIGRRYTVGVSMAF